jgi:hypothetical protein
MSRFFVETVAETCLVQRGSLAGDEHRAQIEPGVD